MQSRVEFTAAAPFFQIVVVGGPFPISLKQLFTRHARTGEVCQALAPVAVKTADQTAKRCNHCQNSWSNRELWDPILLG